MAKGETRGYLGGKRGRMGHLRPGRGPAESRTEMVSGEATADDAPWHTTDENEGETR